MDFNHDASIYLTRVSVATLALSNMIGCDDMTPEAVHKIVITMRGLEDSTADFITDLNVAAESAKVCRETFIHANEIAVRRLEKLQLQGYNFDELITALKLEIETLNKELDFA